MQPETVETTVWTAPELQAEFLLGRFAGFNYDVHTHDTPCFALITAGAIRIRMRGSEFVARQGDLYAIDADEPHAGWPVDAQGWSQRTLYVELAQIRSLVGEDGGARTAGLAGPIIRDPALAGPLHAMHRCSQKTDQGCGPRLLRDEAYIAFASQLLQRHVRAPLHTRAGGREDMAVKAAREFLDQNLGDHVSLEDIALAAGVPRFRLFRAFERSIGMTPHAYQRQARVRLAIRLIRARHSLAEAGAASGFTDQAHFTRWFRRFMAVTPGQYQKAVLGKTTA
jgi:AraC-like DNA-binding protein